MSFDPLRYAQLPYGGTPFSQTVKTLAPATLSPRFVPITINWLQYFTLNPQANLSIPINLQGGSTQGGLLDKIASCKIDNTNSSVSVSVFFPDTGDILTCAPETVVTLPVMTNGLQCFIIAQGLAAGFTPTTKVFLANYFLPPSIDQQAQLTFPQYLGSPTIQRAGLLTAGFGSPALGDQMSANEFDGSVNFSAPLWGTPKPSGFIYLASIQTYVTNARTGSARRMSIESQGISGVLFSFSFFISVPATTSPSKQIDYNQLFSQSGMNVKLDATETWLVTINATVTQGLFGAISSFTYIP